MAFRDDVTVDWSVSPRIITIEAPSTDISIQDLYDTLRELESRQGNLIFNSIVSAGGKEELGGGTLVGITLTLINALLKFEDRITEQVVAKVSGGNLVATDANGNFVDPLAFSDNVNAFIAQSSSATIRDQRLQEATKFLIESGRDVGSGFGEIIFWDPATGDDSASGELPESAIQTFSTAIGMAENGRGDIIFLINRTGNTVIIPENIDVNVVGVKVRGSGPAVFLPPSGVPVTLSASSTSIEGFSVAQTFGGNDAVFIDDADGVSIRNFKIISSSGIGVNINGGEGHIIERCQVGDTAGAGVRFQNVTDSVLQFARVIGAGTWGIDIAADTTAGSRGVGLDTVVVDSSGTGGVRIGQDVIDTIILHSCHIGDDNPILVEDNGINTDYARDIIQLRQADTNLKELLINQTTPGSVGKAIGDIVNTNVLTESAVSSGSTASEIRTGLTQPDGYFDNLFVQIIDGSDISTRKINTYQNINGAIFPEEDFPFIPSDGARVFILSNHDPRNSG